MEPRSPAARHLRERPALSHYLFAFGVLMVLWLLLVGTLQKQEVIAGVIAALLITLVAGSRLAIFTGIRFSLLAPVHMVRYLAYFLVALVRAKPDVAWRVLSPSLPIRPGVVAERNRQGVALLVGKTALGGIVGKLFEHRLNCREADHGRAT